MKLSRATAMFGQMNKGALRTVTLTGYNRFSDTIRPMASNLPRHIDVRFEPAAVPPGEQTSIVFFMRSDKCPLYGFVEDSIYISPDPLSSLICPITTTAIIQEDFSKLSAKQLANAPKATLSAESVDFGKVEGTAPLTRSITITNTGKSEMTVRRVYSGDSGVLSLIHI